MRLKMMKNVSKQHRNGHWLNLRIKKTKLIFSKFEKYTFNYFNLIKRDTNTVVIDDHFL